MARCGGCGSTVPQIGEPFTVEQIALAKEVIDSEGWRVIRGVWMVEYIQALERYKLAADDEQRRQGQADVLAINRVLDIGGTMVKLLDEALNRAGREAQNSAALHDELMSLLESSNAR